MTVPIFDGIMFIADVKSKIFPIRFLALKLIY